MTGRPDYDAGDLVVCWRTRPAPSGKKRKGVVFRCVGLVFVGGKWGALIEGDPSPHRSRAWLADAYRKIDPKPPEFWTGTIDADAPEQVPA
jgi:hypothetical protein